MRPIDANKLMEHLTRCIDAEKGLFRAVCVAIKCFVEQMPTVDAVEVVHGEWIMRGGIFRCSECDSKALLKLDSNVGGCREYTHFCSNYCPNCGAKMDGDS